MRAKRATAITIPKMPKRFRVRFKRRRRRPFRRRRFVRRNRRRRFVAHPTRTLSLRGTAFPKVAIATMPIVFVQNLTNFPGSGASKASLFRLNSVYDPLWTTGGHQPVGFDQLAQIYRTYTVLSCRYSCRFTMEPNIGLTDTDYGDRHVHVGSNVFMAERNTYPYVLGVKDHLAEPTTRYKELSPTPGAYSSWMIRGSINMSRYLSMKVTTENALRSDSNDNPPNRLTPLVAFFMRNTGAGPATTTRVRMSIRLTYRVMWRDPVTIVDDGIEDGASTPVIS